MQISEFIIILKKQLRFSGHVCEILAQHYRGMIRSARLTYSIVSLPQSLRSRSILRPKLRQVLFALPQLPARIPHPPFGRMRRLG